MTVAQYVSLTNAIKRCVALCLGPEWDFDIDDVLHLLKEQFPDVVEAARERMADLGFKQEIKRHIKKPSPQERRAQLSFLPLDYPTDFLCPVICCPPEGADLDAEEDEGNPYPRVPLAQGAE
jgi:hypothetical protein